MKLLEAIELYLSARRGVIGDRTLVMYSKTLARFADFAGDPDLETVTVNNLRAYRGHELDRGLSPYSAHKRCRELKTFFRWLYDEEIIDRNPTARFELPFLPDKEPKAASVEDVERVLGHLSYCQHWGLEPQALICRERAILLFLCDSGGRVGGLCGLTLDRLDLDNHEAVVIEKGRAGGKQRVVYFGERTESAIRDWLRYRPDPVDPEANNVFLSVRGASVQGGKGERGRPLSGGQINQLLKKWARRAGVEGRFNPHSFRHMAAREWLKNGGNLAVVSQLLGHSSIEVTAAHYARWAQSELKKIHAELSEYLYQEEPAG